MNEITQNDYIEACRRINPRLRALHVPRPILGVLAQLAAVVSALTTAALPLSPYRLRSSRPLFPFDVSAAHDRLGWTPKVGVRRALAAASPDRVAQLPMRYAQSAPTSPDRPRRFA